MIFSFGGLGLALGLVAFGLRLALGLVILSFGGLRLGLVAQGLALGLGLVKVAIVPTLLFYNGFTKYPTVGQKRIRSENLKKIKLVVDLRTVILKVHVTVCFK